MIGLLGLALAGLFLTGCINLPHYKENAANMPAIQQGNGRLFLLHTPARNDGIGLLVDGFRIRALFLNSCTYIDLKAGDHEIQACDPTSLETFCSPFKVSIAPNSRKLVQLKGPNLPLFLQTQAKGEFKSIEIVELPEDTDIDATLRKYVFLPAESCVRLQDYHASALPLGVTNSLAVSIPTLEKDIRTYDQNSVIGVTINEMVPNFPTQTTTSDSIPKWVQAAAVAELSQSGFYCSAVDATTSGLPKININVTQLFVGVESGLVSLTMKSVIRLTIVVERPGVPGKTIDVIGEGHVKLGMIATGWENRQATAALNLALQACIAKALPEIAASMHQ